MAKTKTEWNLGLLYKNGKDPQIEKDFLILDRANKAFEKKYKGKNFVSSSATLVRVLEDYEKLSEIAQDTASWWYFELRKTLDSDDKEAIAQATKYQQRFTESGNRIKFFNLEIGKIDQKKQKAFLKDKKLSKYKYFLERIFAVAKHNLSEAEEQLEGLLSQTSYSMWVDAQQKILSQKTIEHKGKQIPIAEVIGTLKDKSDRERQVLNKKINQTLKMLSGGAEGEINAIYNYKKVMDDRRGYKHPYSETILNFENDEKSIINFVGLITRNFDIAHRFYKLHAKLINKKKLTAADRSVPMGRIKTRFDFGKSISIYKKMLSEIDGPYRDIFEKFVQNGQIDVFPKKGKMGGAFCWGTGRQPTFVLLNHVNDAYSLEVLAHEMGHAFHGELIKEQTPIYRGYTISTAEVASTFFEQMALDVIQEMLPDKEKVILLHNKIMGDISTIFRQIACFNFELELHNLIRENGQLSKEEIAGLMKKHLESYMGPAFDLTLDDGYFYVYWSHIRRFFYVYTYAYGQLVSKAMYEKWKENPQFANKVEQFLRAGMSMSPEDIFKSIGIDVSNPKFFADGLKAIEKDIEKLEKLAKKLKV